MSKLSRSYSDPQILYSDTGSQMLSQSQDVLAEEKPMQSLSLPNAHQLRKPHSIPSSTDTTPSPPLVDSLSQEVKLQHKEESLPSLAHPDTKESCFSPDTTASPPQSLADHGSLTEALKQEVKSSQSPSAKKLHKSTSLSRAGSPSQGKTDNQALESQKPEETLHKSSLLTKAASQSSSTFRDVTTLIPQPLADCVSSTETLRPHKSDDKSQCSPILPSAKQLKESASLSTAQSYPQGMIGHQAQSQEREEKLPKSSQSSSKIPDVSSSSDDHSSQLHEGCPQVVPSARPAEKHSKSCVNMHSEDLMKTEGSANKTHTAMGRKSPGLLAMHSLDVSDGVPVCSKLHLPQSSRSLDNPNYTSSDVKPEVTIPSDKPVNQTTSDDNKNARQVTPSPSKSGKSHSAGQLGISMEELNREVYSFVANTLQPQGEAKKSDSSLSDIFKRHCQKFEQLSKPQPHEVTNKEKETAKLIPESSRHRKGTRSPTKRPQLPPRPKEIVK